MNRDYLNDRRHFVYRHFDADGQVLYVGCTHDVAKRFKQQMFENTWWAERVAKTKITVHSNRSEARRAEKSEIARLEPLHSGETYWMNTSAWSPEKFVAHGRALSEGTFASYTDGKSALGNLFVAYFNKFQRNLFADMGLVQPGHRNSIPYRKEPLRYLTFTGHLRGVEAAA